MYSGRSEGSGRSSSYSHRCGGPHRPLC